MKSLSLFVASAFTATALCAQTAPEAVLLSGDDLNGTARFMSMAGAFSALGGDLSTLNQNPAGIGIYRSSEIGVTMNINMLSTKSTSGNLSATYNQTKVTCPNFGYVGTWKTNSELMPYFNWGVTYGRTQDLTRRYGGDIPALRGSLSEYIAGFSNGWSADELYSGTGFNPYLTTGAPWLSILAYNGCIINPLDPNDGDCATYHRLLGNGTASGSFYVDQHGYIDQYSINFGGNFVNMVYWGLGIGISDLSMDRYTSYSERISDGMVPYQTDPHSPVDVRTGSGAYTLESWQSVRGSGVNLKLGVILKPINEFRIGLAVHTPTWYSLQNESYASVSGNFSAVGQRPLSTYTDTNDGYNDYIEWKLASPWRLIVGAAGVLGSKAIISADYEYRPYQSASTRSSDGRDFYYVKEDLENYYQATSQVRIGAEYRLTSNFSIRAGYSYTSSPVKGESVVNQLLSSPETRLDTDNPYDTGTTPSFTLAQATNMVTCGIGYHYGMFYADAAYVHRSHSSEFRPWSAPDNSVKLKDSDNTIVISAGIKF